MQVIRLQEGAAPETLFHSVTVDQVDLFDTEGGDTLYHSL